MKNYYGKDSKDFTEAERQLLNADMMLLTSLRMNRNGEMLLGFGMCVGTDEDVEMRFEHRYDLVVEMLGLKNPESEEEAEKIVELVNETPYCFDTFMDVFLSNEREAHTIVESKRMAVMN